MSSLDPYQGWRMNRQLTNIDTSICPLDVGDPQSVVVRRRKSSEYLFSPENAGRKPTVSNIGILTPTAGTLNHETKPLPLLSLGIQAGHPLPADSL